MAHTPGPWHFNGRRITTGAFIVADIWNANEPVGQANAALIAKAPSMYEALKALVQPRNECYPRSKRSMKVALALIDEIEGCQP